MASGLGAACIAAGIGTALLAGAAPAATLASGSVAVATPAGSVLLVSRIDDQAGSDPARWRFEYELSGDLEPFPGESNGLSSLQILFAAPLADVRGQSAPDGWLLDCCLAAPPFGVGFDLDNSTGFGPAPGTSALFSFTAPAGTAWTDLPAGSFVASHVADVPAGFVELIDDASGAGPIVPAPEPAAPEALLAAAAVLLGYGALSPRRTSVSS